MENKKIDLSVKLGELNMKNPVIAASGTYGFGREYSDYIDLNKWGGIAVKGLTLKERQGNPPPRIVETPSGMLNAVGLQNPGVDRFIKHEIPFLRKYNLAVIANVAGNTPDEYVEMVSILNRVDIDAIEINLSCPNVNKGCIAFGSTEEGVTEIVKSIRKATDKMLIVKLTPNVTDITALAKAAEYAGADAISLINTLLGMVIDINTKKPVLANNTGGLSGPAVRPVAVRMTYQTAQAVKIPVIGMGGITCGRDVVEFLLAGASAVMVGTWNFVDPMCINKITRELQEYMELNNFYNIKDIVGKVTLN